MSPLCLITEMGNENTHDHVCKECGSERTGIYCSVCGALVQPETETEQTHIPGCGGE